MRNTWTCFSRIAALAVAAIGLTLVAAPAMAQYYYTCPPGYYFAQGYGCVASPPPVYYYAPPAPPPVVYPAPFIGFGFAFGGHDRDDWHGGGDWHRH